MSTSRTSHAVAHRQSGPHDRLVAARRAPSRAHLRLVPDLPDAPDAPRSPRRPSRRAPRPAVAGRAAGPRPPRAGGRAQAVRDGGATGGAVRDRRAARSGGRPGPVRLTPRGRVVVVMFLSAVLVVSGWFVGRAVAEAATTQAPAAPSVIAHHGDTLWAIAARSRPNEDPRVTIHQIMRLNGLSSPVIQPGQRVVLPRS